MDELPPHPAIGDPLRCGARVWIHGHEWICIRHVHMDENDRHRSIQPHPYYPQSERHYYVRRYPDTDH